MPEVCQSYRPGICRDGFPTSAACVGHRCPTCGQWAAERKPPACLRDDFLPPHLFDDAGRTLLQPPSDGGAR